MPNPTIQIALTMMPAEINQQDYAFLNGGGEMGERIRNNNWDATTLGNPDHWPENLRTIIRQEIPKLALQVYTIGVPYIALGVPLSLNKNKDHNKRYTDFSFQPIYDSTGVIYGVLATSLDMTESGQS